MSHVGEPVIAVVPAGGRGARMGHDVPKQFLYLGDVPLLVHALRVLESSPAIDAIVMVVPRDDVSYCRRELVSRFALAKITHVVPGGARRQDSVWNGLQAVAVRDGIVLVHDAVRPFVTGTMVRDVVDRARIHGAAAVAVPVRDTVKRVTPDGIIETTLDRHCLWLAQTPQAFTIEVLRDAHRRSQRHGLEATDDAFLVEQSGHAVSIVTGSPDNMKMTSPEDLAVGEAILSARSHCPSS